MRFELIRGTFRIGKVVYRATKDSHPIVCHENDLCEGFKNQFRRLDNEDRDTQPVRATRRTAMPEEETPTPALAPVASVVPATTSPAPAPAPAPAPGPEAPKVTLKMKHKGRGRYDVVKVIDDVETDECVNETYLKKREAEALVAGGLPKE